MRTESARQPLEEPPLKGMGQRFNPTTKVILVLVITSIISAGIGAAATLWVRSPAQLAADSKPPSYTKLTTKVTEGVATQIFTFQGEITDGNVRSYTPASGVVTALAAEVGSSIGPGTLLASVNDRPIFYLQGEIPMLRDINPGDTGADVARLKAALAPWGSLTANATYDYSTVIALRNLYKQAGVTPPEDGAARASELMFVPATSARIISFGAATGEQVGNDFIRVALGTPQVTAKLADELTAQLQAGAAVTISGSGIGKIEGSISSIGPAAKTEDAGYQATVTVAPTAELSPNTIGAKVEVALTPTTPAESGLLVPLPALYSKPGGGSAVFVQHGKTFQRVPVQVDEIGDGVARITPEKSAALKVGSRVLVGKK